MKQLVRQFVERYGSTPQFYRSPGRINILGEHTDYNDCWCLPMAVDRYINVLISQGATKVHRIYFEQLDKAIEVPVNLLGTGYLHQTYLSPVFELLEKRGFSIEPVDLLISGDIPVGAGMSSSAALCVSSFYALNDFFNLGLDKKEIALLSQQVENEYMGLSCGLLDQLSVLFCVKSNATYMHPASATLNNIPFEMPDHQLVLVNSMVQHELSATEYNTRREESTAALKQIQSLREGVHSFKDLLPADVIALEEEMDATLYKRALHIVSENQRVHLAVEDLKNGSWQSLGMKMFGSHESLKNYYQVSCTQLDFLVERASYIDGVLGSRMMGGGFGGCTINLVEKQALEEFQKSMTKSYLQLFKIEPEIYILDAANGAEKIEIG
ncbi:galactokinase [Gynurincola endophyticus]|jgi:galactokinase|uniref:galactokinase n=1 Tax=Gynurincola endophyticus TaxID=2479004 RepID=UPI000F8DD31C|nr:galactokinase [Gynurincola endophyticus]